MTAWLTIVGMGDEGITGLGPSARAAIARAELLVGGRRHLALVPDGPAERLTWATPLSVTVEAIAAHRDRPVTVLATGDPMCFGVGVTLARRFPRAEMEILPAPGAFTLAAARLGWPLSEVDGVTVHGRPLDLINRHLQPGGRIFVLSEDGATPAALARRLVERGFGPSRFVVLEHMGGADERIVEATAETWDQVSGGAEAADLNTVALELRATPEAEAWPLLPGLPDYAFRHDGQLTKREVRAATLALLAPMPGDLLWDVGAGCGSIAIEWLRVDRRLKAIAIERDAGRATLVRENAAALGVPFLTLREGEAPAALDGLEAPDAVFIGGGLGAPGLVEHCWERLKPRGRLVANAVTVEGESALAGWHGKLGGALTRIAVARAEPVGRLLGWRPLMPITQWCAVKPP
jgi:precorrin-6Y C5,15-methyltransferase (decarboxylating)